LSGIFDFRARIFRDCVIWFRLGGHTLCDDFSNGETRYGRICKRSAPQCGALLTFARRMRHAWKLSGDEGQVALLACRATLTLPATNHGFAPQGTFS
jgi:hypothetical protein